MAQQQKNNQSDPDCRVSNGSEHDSKVTDPRSSRLSFLFEAKPIAPEPQEKDFSDTEDDNVSPDEVKAFTGNSGFTSCSSHLDRREINSHSSQKNGLELQPII